MTIDHIGAYLYPDELWFRAVGRITFPVWFFLAGYVRTAKFSQMLMVYAFVVHIGNVATFYPLLPLNALFSIVCCRMFVAYLIKKGSNFTNQSLGQIIVTLAIWHFPLSLLFDYGGLALLYALLGHMVRIRNDETPSGDLNKIKYILVFFFSFVAFVVLQQIDFGFSVLQFTFVLVGTAITVYCLYGFKVSIMSSRVFSSRTIALPMLFLSRYSLEYYLVHRVVLQVLSCFLVESHEHVFKWFNV